MAESGIKRPRRTVEQRIAEIDALISKLEQGIIDLQAKQQESIRVFDGKIASAQDKIKSLKQKRENVLAPKLPRKRRKTKKQKIQEIVKQAQKTMKPEEIAERLGLELQED